MLFSLSQVTEAEGRLAPVEAARASAAFLAKQFAEAQARLEASTEVLQERARARSRRKLELRAEGICLPLSLSLAITPIRAVPPAAPPTVASRPRAA